MEINKPALGGKVSVELGKYHNLMLVLHPLVVNLLCQRFRKLRTKNSR
jgi:hypothetical protein